MPDSVKCLFNVKSDEEFALVVVKIDDCVLNEMHYVLSCFVLCAKTCLMWFDDVFSGGK